MTILFLLLLLACLIDSSLATYFPSCLQPYPATAYLHTTSTSSTSLKSSDGKYTCQVNFNGQLCIQSSSSTWCLPSQTPSTTNYDYILFVLASQYTLQLYTVTIADDTTDTYWSTGIPTTSLNSAYAMLDTNGELAIYDSTHTKTWTCTAVGCPVSGPSTGTCDGYTEPTQFLPPTESPTLSPNVKTTVKPTKAKSSSARPTAKPIRKPTAKPTKVPSNLRPTTAPTKKAPKPTKSV